MSLRYKFLIINTIIFISAFLFSIGTFWYLAEQIVKKWSSDIAENQMLYNKSRVLQILVREIALSTQIAKSKTIIDWAYHQDDPDYESRGIEEMENYKKSFSEGSYFIAFYDTGKYFYNNYKNTYAGSQFRYRLNPAMKHDAWFYSIIKENKDFHVNVNPDVYLNVTKVWIDVLIKDNDKILGVLGTGMDLDKFIKHYAVISGKGMKSIFMDYSAAVQIYYDKNFIDFASITKLAENKNTAFEIFDRDEDIDFIKNAMSELKYSSNDSVKKKFVVLNGIRYLAGISYIGELDWYQMVLNDTHNVLTLEDFKWIILSFIVTLLVAFLVYNYIIRVHILDKLQNLEISLRKVKNSDFSFLDQNISDDDEFGVLMRHFTQMALSVKENKEMLEKKVAERTLELEKISQTDMLTGLLNRRGTDIVLTRELERSKRLGYNIGILVIDIDLFKTINDRFGHQIGDNALIAVANYITKSIRSYDFAVRWGGDEFLVILPDVKSQTLTATGERILKFAGNISVDSDNLEKTLRFTMSIGGYISEYSDTIEDMLSRADRALYKAKEDGRNCFRIFS